MPELMPAESQEAQGQPTPSGLPIGAEPGSFDSVDENTVSPEEQSQYDQFVAKAGKLIFKKKSRDAVLEQMNQKDMPVYAAVGRAAAHLAGALVDQAKASGVKLSPDVVFHATADFVIPSLFEIGQTAKIIPADDDQNQMHMAFLEAQKVYGEQMLKGPDAKKLSGDAQDFYAEQVGNEVDSGQADGASFREGTLGAAKDDPLASAVTAEMQKMGGAKKGIM